MECGVFYENVFFIAKASKSLIYLMCWIFNGLMLQTSASNAAAEAVKWSNSNRLRGDKVTKKCFSPHDLVWIQQRVVFFQIFGSIWMH